MKQIKLIALDLDGTLLGPDGTIAVEDKMAVREAVAEGITVIASSGRPYIGLPLREMIQLNMNFAITTNGAAVYRVPERQCIFEDPLDTATAFRIIDGLDQWEIYYDVFVNGGGIGNTGKMPVLKMLPLPKPLLDYKIKTRSFSGDLKESIRATGHPVQKITVDFLADQHGTRLYRDEVNRFLDSIPNISVVSGGNMDLEINKCGVTKSHGLAALCSMLNIGMDETMAIGDSDNDINIIHTAGLGVAMANASPGALEHADAITASNTQHGVADAIRQYAL